jgi:galactokinase
MFAGVGVALSVLAFFLKKNKLEIDRLSEMVRNLELSDATKSERLKTIGKVLEDRRRDVQKLFEKIK